MLTELNLDKLAGCTPTPEAYESMIRQCREANRLRAELADARLMLRALGNVDMVSHSMDLAGGWNIEVRGRCSDERCDCTIVTNRLRLAGDGTGLPVVTEEARLVLGPHAKEAP